MEQPLGVCILLIKDERSVLLGERKGGYMAGTFGCPGGRIEAGEAMVDAARRELEEETGLTAKKLSYLGFIKEYQVGGDFIHFVFVCDDWLGELRNCEPDKCGGWSWYSFKELPTPLLRGHQAAMELLTARVPYLEK